MDVLLIGGSRFLGRAIADAFAAAGHRVHAMNRGSHPPCASVAETLTCDKNERQAFAAVLTRRRWDVIVDTILTDQDLKFVVETLGHESGHLIHTGSLGVYGEARQIPATETLPLREQQGDEVVFDHKIRQDRVLLQAFLEGAFPGTILRMSYIYGAGDVPLDGWGGRAPEFFQRLRAGEVIPLADEGRALLHPGHVRDLGRAFVHVAERPAAAIGQVYNIAGPYAMMMRDYVALLARLLGVEPRFEFVTREELLGRFPDGVVNARGLRFACQHMCASIVRAERELDWQPRIPLAAGLRENLDWLRASGRL